MDGVNWTDAAAKQVIQQQEEAMHGAAACPMDGPMSPALKSKQSSSSMEAITRIRDNKMDG